MKKLQPAPLSSVEPMPRAERVRAVVDAIRSLGPARERVLSEVRDLVGMAQQRHSRIAPSHYGMICREGRGESFLAGLVAWEAAMRDRGEDPDFRVDGAALDPIEIRQIERERIAVTLTAVLEDPDAEHDGPWPVVMAPPHDGPRSWDTLERLIAAERMDQHSAEDTVGYLRAACHAIRALHDPEGAEGVEVRSWSVPQVASVVDVIRWLQERAADSIEAQLREEWRCGRWFARVTEYKGMAGALRDASSEAKHGQGALRKRKRVNRDDRDKHSGHNEYPVVDVAKRSGFSAYRKVILSAAMAERIASQSGTITIVQQSQNGEPNRRTV